MYLKEATLNRKWFNACEEESLEKIKYYTKQGIDINLRNEEGETALINLCAYGNEIIVEYLLKKGANVDIYDNGGYTALHAAVHQGNYKCAKLLIKYGANINAVTSYMHDNPMSVLMIACFTDGYKFVKLLIKKGVDINYKNVAGETALMYTCDPNANIATLLLNNGAIADDCDKDGDTVLMHAIRNGCTLTLLFTLLNNGAKINVKNMNGQTAMDYVYFYSKSADQRHKLEVNISAYIHKLIDKKVDNVSNNITYLIYPIRETLKKVMLKNYYC